MHSIDISLTYGTSIKVNSYELEVYLPVIDLFKLLS